MSYCLMCMEWTSSDHNGWCADCRAWCEYAQLYHPEWDASAARWMKARNRYEGIGA